MGETCNHVTAAMFGVGTAVCTGLTNPSCISSANEWLPCRKDIGPTKRSRTCKNLNFDYLYKDGGTVKSKQNHKYFTQCLMQMGITRTKNDYFVVSTTHGTVIDNIPFAKELWESIKSNFEMFFKDFERLLFKLIFFRVRV